VIGEIGIPTGAGNKHNFESRDPHVTLDNFDFDLNKKMNRNLVFDLATATFIARREDAFLLGPPGTGKAIWPRPSGRRSSARAIG